ncbi:tryptophan-rich sensory protein [Janibacter limosus]|uniref:Tryptophan-rich sensory protein n=1 Tax=Janibacter limosus TaxID=53458 RepID=A0AC61U7E2_9MICO|nr:tryptophan-rich sensory protein [Janibacter limosus]UUZ45898.1 tryptophan-rich sensory protein [Janibacter limosus]
MSTSTATPFAPGTVLVTGATGYIGGLLVPRLLGEGWTVRVLTRSADKLRAHDWGGRVEVVEGDATSGDDLRRALSGTDVAYYLVHSMDGGGDLARRDRELAEGFATAAADAGVSRIVYLGGLHPEGADLSVHLASRVEVGQVLLDAPVPAAVLQAAVVVPGDGSVSFDMLRYLTERLPAMVAPQWLRNRIQPIAVDDALHYLVGAARLPEDVNRTFDIGGPEVLTYEQMIQRFAAVNGLRRRLIVGVPVLTPWLASHWVGLITPVEADVAKPLVGSLVHEVVRREQDLDDHVGLPEGGLVGFDDAVRRAMRTAQPDHVLRDVLTVTAATVGAAALGAAATQPDSRWYRSLDLPSWQPPPLAFPPVWTPLYADIVATSVATLARLEGEGRPDEAAAYRRALWGNLVLNTAWSVLFWRVRRPAVAAVEAGVLAASSTDPARRAAAAGGRGGWALVPYAAWTGFAAVLSTAIARRNR